MSFWDLFDDLLGPLSPIDRAEGFFSAIRYGDWKRASKSGPAGYATEFLRSATGSNCAKFSIPATADHNLVEVEKILRRYGIPVFGRTYDAGHMYFSVKKRQASWAEYIMLNAGVELDNPTFDRRNPSYVGRHGPGWMPTPWAEQERKPTAKSPAAEVPAAKPTSSLGRLSRWMDELLED